MSISEQIVRIQNARNTIRTKLTDLGLGDGTEKLEVCAEKISGITNRGSVSIQVKDDETKSLEPGYYSGGTISGMVGGGNTKLDEAKTVTPSKGTQVITPGEGFYGLPSVTVNPIPAQYQDVTSVNVPAEFVLSPWIYVNSEGTEVAGTMINHEAVSATMTGLTAETSS